MVSPMTGIMIWAGGVILVFIGLYIVYKSDIDDLL